jgi:predicted metal-binding transcription factor (methanogenesis marker protein 9)
MKKTELIRAIQGAEGNNTCYGTTNGTCQWTECCFRPDCLKIRN